MAKEIIAHIIGLIGLACLLNLCFLLFENGLEKKVSREIFAYGFKKGDSWLVFVFPMLLGIVCAFVTVFVPFGWVAPITVAVFLIWLNSKEDEKYKGTSDRAVSASLSAFAPAYFSSLIPLLAESREVSWFWTLVLWMVAAFFIYLLSLILKDIRKMFLKAGYDYLARRKLAFLIFAVLLTMFVSSLYRLDEFEVVLFMLSAIVLFLATAWFMNFTQLQSLKKGSRVPWLSVLIVTCSLLVAASFLLLKPFQLKICPACNSVAVIIISAIFIGFLSWLADRKLLLTQMRNELEPVTYFE